MRDEIKAALQNAVIEAENWSELAENLASIIPRTAQGVFVAEFLRGTELRLTRIRARQKKDLVSEIQEELKGMTTKVSGAGGYTTVQE